MSKNLLINTAMVFLLLIASSLMGILWLELFVPALILVPIFLEPNTNFTFRALLRNTFLLLSLILLSKNTLFAFMFFEIAILFEIGLRGIKSKPFSLVSLFSLGLMLFAGLAKAPGELWLFKNDNLLFVLILFRVFCELAHSHTRKMNMVCLYAFSIIFSSWWSLSTQMLFLIVVLIILLEQASVRLRLKSASQGLTCLIMPILLFSVLGSANEIVLIYFINELLVKTLLSNNTNKRELFLIYLATIIYLIWETVLRVSSFDMVILVSALLISWMRLYRINDNDESKEVLNSARANMGLVLCMLGVLSFVL